MGREKRNKKRKMEYSVSESLGEGWGDVRLVFIAEREQEHAREKERERECMSVCWGWRVGIPGHHEDQ